MVGRKNVYISLGWVAILQRWEPLLLGRGLTLIWPKGPHKQEKCWKENLIEEDLKATYLAKNDTFLYLSNFKNQFLVKNSIKVPIFQK